MKKIIVGIDGSKESFDSYRCVPEFFPDEEINLEAVFVIDERKTQIPFIYSGAAYDVAYERLYIPVDPGLKDFYEKLNKDNRIFADKCMDICNGIKMGSKVHQSEVVLEGEPSEQLLEHLTQTLRWYYQSLPNEPPMQIGFHRDMHQF